MHFSNFFCTASNTEQVLRQHPTKQQLYGHLPPIMKTIKVRRTRHVEHCWRSKDELISDVHLWTPSHGWAKAGWPARIYIQQLCADMGCTLKTCWKQRTIETGGDRGSGISVLMVQYDDDDDDDKYTSDSVLWVVLSPTNLNKIFCFFQFLK